MLMLLASSRVNVLTLIFRALRLLAAVGIDELPKPPLGPKPTGTLGLPLLNPEGTNPAPPDLDAAAADEEAAAPAAALLLELLLPDG